MELTDRKPNDKPIYVHRKSNHPPNVLDQIPKSINKRLAAISSSREEFEAAAPEYQKALNDSGYDHKLEFQTPTARKKKPRRRNILWFNPPYNASVTTNIGAAFLRLVDKHFPKDNPLHRIINRNTVKVSYCCTKTSNQSSTPTTRRCYTMRREKCPPNHATVNATGEPSAQ